MCPIGFVADHLAIIYDLDVETREFAALKGIRLRRAASFNARPEFIDALAAIVRDALEAHSAGSNGPGGGGRSAVLADDRRQEES